MENSMIIYFQKLISISNQFIKHHTKILNKRDIRNDTNLFLFFIHTTFTVFMSSRLYHFTIICKVT